MFLLFLFFLVYCCYICSLNCSQKHFNFDTGKWCILLKWHAFLALLDQIWKKYLFLLWLQSQINHNLKFPISITVTIIQVQVIVIQLQLQWKDSQNIATNSLTYEASRFVLYLQYTVDLLCISIPDLSKPHFSLPLFFHQSLFNFNFCYT